MKRLSCAVLAALAAATPALSQDRYVPAGIWRHADDDTFLENWFGSQLRAMGEPILSRAGDRGRYNMRLRMLVLPSFEHGFAIRIDESASGALVSFVEITGAGGYAPGRVGRRASYRLTATEMRDVHHLVRDSGLASAPPWAPPPPPVEAAGGGQIVTVCADATHYVLELADRNGSRFIERSDCDLPRVFQTLVREMLTLHPDARRQY